MLKQFDSMIKKWSKGEKIVAAIFMPVVLFLVSYLLFTLVMDVLFNDKMGRHENFVYVLTTTIIVFLAEMRIFKNFNNKN